MGSAASQAKKEAMGKVGKKDLAAEKKVDDPSQSARAFYVSSSEPKD